MRLYDTARAAVVPFEPSGSQVSVYVCGITPYDAAHIGHAFTYHVFDVIIRRLRRTGQTVRSVRNVTDVDDDIVRVARERGVDMWTLAESQLTLFEDDMRSIGLLPVDGMPHASRHVPEMLGWIERLVAGGHAYAVDGWVYFDVARFSGYGRLSRLDAAAMVGLARQRGGDPDDPRKRQPLDFVLWQPSARGEPRWPSAWGQGRPGWHIECSVMSTGSLGAPVDIHGGGDDLIFPHHESEIAQAEAAGVVPYVRHWVHVAMVRYRGEKMSKSLGNLIFVRDLLRRASASSVRILLASHHHRESWEFEEHEIAAAEMRAARYAEALQADVRIPAPEAAEIQAQLDDRIDDDVDTPGALHVIDSFATRLLQAPRPPAAGATVSGSELMSQLLDALGAPVPTLAVER
jgi:L-cysteine:1D-myo-inositol 2-amino-2-deoxy-alpha-D-glucopyranoside ligase